MSKWIRYIIVFNNLKKKKKIKKGNNKTFGMGSSSQFAGLGKAYALAFAERGAKVIGM